ncbi:hypothetical protein GCM10010123_06200 [Pilimelia anulata]|uniref:Insertion element protein n=1 Tax=Pilimelia anulata TaxID=53371 RepID=A0A8J3F8K0_9ACTN|nr:hypothetical protein [Pilimelia anulata]GGJ79038.1 hypothetical protein GCM10010123_06200 [Pilimelia anulata]
MSGRVPTQYCPYCGEENLYPHLPDEPGERGHPWECRSCARVFTVSFRGLLTSAEGWGS